MVTIEINQHGDAEAINGPDAQLLTKDLGRAALVRVSVVEPVDLLRRLAFRIIRRLVSDQSTLAAWTRTWRGPWRSRLLVGSRPILGPYEIRSEAIAAEVRWLEQWRAS